MTLKRVIHGVLVLGWIPTLMTVGGFRWLGEEAVTAQARTPITLTRIYTGPDGKTHAEELDVTLGAPRGTTEVADPIPVTSLQFRGPHQSISSTGTTRRDVST